MAKYIGITIGPIFDTLADAATPAALWFASSIFSDITRRICKKLTGSGGFSDAKIIAPFYNEEMEKNDGVGKYHDRVIFSTNQYERDKLSHIIAKVKQETECIFPEELKLDFFSSNSREELKEFFMQYFQIHYVVMDEEKIMGNVILTLSPCLEELELMKTFPLDDTKNIIRKMFNGKCIRNPKTPIEVLKNYYIKDSRLFTSIKKESNQIKKNDISIWNIEEIASCHEQLAGNYKRSKYFAVVQADGDRLSEFLKGLNEDSLITEFQRACLTYNESASEIIGQYGGMTIYAGGDDLLFLAPVMNIEENTIFGLCNEINTIFQNTFLSCGFKSNIPTISFGISIQYMKYPLYEALASAKELLFQVAKKSNEKNCMAVRVLKHSGKSMDALIPNHEYNTLKEILEITHNEDENRVHSVLYTLGKLHPLVSILNRKSKKERMSSEMYLVAWNNFFDNPKQKQFEKYITSIGKAYYKNFIERTSHIVIPQNISQKIPEAGDDTIHILVNLLQIGKFLVEKGELR